MHFEVNMSSQGESEVSATVHIKVNVSHQEEREVINFYCALCNKCELSRGEYWKKLLK
jgi:hypothetical protein